MNLADKLKYLRTEKRLTQEELSKILNVSKSAVSGWERGANKPLMDKLGQLSELYSVPISYFFDDSDILEAEALQIPIIGAIACGEPTLADENVIGHRSRSRHGLPRGNVFYLEAQGDSMSPVITDGAYVLIKEQQDVETGEIAAVLVNGDEEATLKRVKKHQGYVILESINEGYDDYIIDENNPAKIIGKAVEVTNKL